MSNWTPVQDDWYPHFHGVYQHVEKGDYLVIESQAQPWLDDVEYSVVRTPSPKSAEISEQVADSVDSLEEAVKQAEQFAGEKLVSE